MRYITTYTILVFLGCSLLACQKQQKLRKVKIGLSHSQNHSFTQALQHFDSLVQLHLPNTFDIEIYHSAILGSEKEMQEMLTLGTMEGAVTGLLNNYDPVFAIFEMPYLYRDRSHVFKVFNGDLIRKVAKPLEEKGIVFAGFYENGFRHLTNSVKPIHSPEDLAGMMIRTPENPAYLETFKAMNVIPTPMSFSELYTALMQNVVDGQENPLQNIWYGRLYEAQGHIALTAHIYNAAYVLFSKRFWDKLSEEEQSIFKECIAASTQWQLAYMKQLDKSLEQKLKQQGMQFSYPNRRAFKAASEPAYEAMYNLLGERARTIVENINNIE